MVKAKKVNSRKTKSDEVPSDVETPIDDIAPADGKNEDESVETQENGDDVSLKKKSKGKASKKEEEDSAKEDDSATNQQNGAGDAGTKKKPASKKSAKTPKQVKEPERKSSRTPKPVEKEGTEESYEVEKIVGFQLRKGKPQYLIRWKGCTKAEDTWESESNLNCPELLQKYKEENPKSAKKRAASKSPVKSAKKKKEAAKDYEVEEIVGVRVKGGKKEFKIRWKGYKPSDDSWEPEKHLSCQDLISKYLEEHKDDDNDEEVQSEEKKTSEKTPAKTSAKSKKSKKTKAK